ncbi:hypothetical protein SeLEV6574_g08522 [Synchytrium endobioticum]|uniref:CN hydrolase domain-containing protein n=1 Tax=Synchytrium endobioticum TaxID=286115 RepID=A0A507BVW9_9FUNG|nr:hypothetical protein SeLEV6574_g08522 [Synchytrium endobioticum]
MAALVGARNFRLALVQLLVAASKETNLQNARRKILEASQNGANVVVLPECFNSPYGTKYFPEYAEKVPGGPSTTALSRMAQDANVWLIGGSIPELSVTDTTKYYNTCTIYSPTGELAATHRKLHLFDIDVAGRLKFTESEVLSAGSALTHVQTDYGKLGIAICYDIRFPELAMIAARKGCVAMLYPGAFNTVTGPLHWELLGRSRALDNQFYVACCSPARDVNFKDYQAYGHSMIVDPMGQVMAVTGEKEDIVYADIDVEKINESRSSIPVSVQRRLDLYDDVAKPMTEVGDGKVFRSIP